MIDPPASEKVMTDKTLREGADSVEAVSSRTAATNESHSDEGPVIQPVPWAISDEGYIVDVNGICLSMLTPDEKRLIVRCVNSHDDLLAALKIAADEVGRYGHGSIAIELRKVIAKAEGR